MSCICESFIVGNRRSFAKMEGTRFSRRATIGRSHIDAARFSSVIWNVFSGKLCDERQLLIKSSA